MKLVLYQILVNTMHKKVLGMQGRSRAGGSSPGGHRILVQAATASGALLSPPPAH